MLCILNLATMQTGILNVFALNVDNLFFDEF